MKRIICLVMIFWGTSVFADTLVIRDITEINTSAQLAIQGMVAGEKTFVFIHKDLKPPVIQRCQALAVAAAASPESFELWLEGVGDAVQGDPGTKSVSVFENFYCRLVSKR